MKKVNNSLTSTGSINLLHLKGSVEEISHCPGIYCGRQKIDNGNSSLWSPCGACPRGSRVDKAGECVECNSSPTTYDWMYLCFMALLGLSTFWKLKKKRIN